MPKFFSNKNEQLHAEAYATFLLIDSRSYLGYTKSGKSVAAILRKANDRVYRRAFAAGMV